MPFDEPASEAYAADITYGTNSEFGFDYLRDNMAVSLEGRVQRGHAYAIVDEVDSILIDEARTPLIISGEPETAAQDVLRLRARRARARGRAATRKADEGRGRDRALGRRLPLRREAQDRLAGADGDRQGRARARDRQPLRPAQRAARQPPDPGAEGASRSTSATSTTSIQDGEVKIVDEFTGRIMEGRRWCEGLHQAIEAKEGVAIQEENVTLATITLQNYFRLYEKLAGMTGTAKTEEKEFVEIYNLHVVEIPTNVPVVREDENDFIFKTKEAKCDAGHRGHRRAPREGPAGARRHDRRRDLRVPRRSCSTRRGHPAQRPEREGARARGRDHQGRRPAGRGHDRDEHGRPRRRHQARRRACVELGGLYVLGTERHEARRIDNQLRGRSGRQGDPGETRFYLSAPGRPRAPVRRRPDLQDHGALQDPGRPADGGDDPLAADRERAEEGRGAELRHAQERPQVRRRDEHAAHGHLRAAPPRARGRGPLRGDRRLDRRGRSSANVDAVHATPRRPRTGTSTRSSRRCTRSTAPTSPSRSCARRSTLDAARRSSRSSSRTRSTRTTSARRSSAPELMREIERYVILQVVDTRWREHLENDGLPARGRPPARDGPEGPARRVPRRGPRDVRGARPGDPRGGRADALPRRGRSARRPSSSSQPVAGARDGARVRARVAAGADAIAAAGGGAATALAAPPSTTPMRPPKPVVNEHGTSAATTRAGAAPARSTRGATARRWRNPWLPTAPPSAYSRVTGRWPPGRKAASGLAGVCTEPAMAGRACCSATIAADGDHRRQTVDEQLEEIGAQLAWVRDYL